MVITTSESRDLALNATFAHADGVVYYLTACCGASAKGAEKGTVCRACYTLIDSRLGMAWAADEFVSEYPAWAAHCGVVEFGDFTFDRYARIIAKQLGI